MKEGSAPTNGPSAKTRTRTCRWKGETQNDENKRTCSFGADMAQKHIQTKLVGGLLERLLSAGEKGVSAARQRMEAVLAMSKAEAREVEEEAYGKDQLAQHDEHRALKQQGLTHVEGRVTFVSRGGLPYSRRLSGYICVTQGLTHVEARELTYVEARVPNWDDIRS
eukprot:7034490-Pyramimonas_sp.AAC.1